MRKQDAEKLYVAVNSKPFVDALLHYSELRVSHLKDKLVMCTTLEELQKIQGAIEEIGRLKTLRDEVNEAKD